MYVSASTLSQTCQIQHFSRCMVGRHLHIQGRTRVSQILCSQNCTLLTNQQSRLRKKGID